MHLGVSSTEESARRIVHSYFHQQGSGILVDGLRGSDQRPGKNPPGKFRQHQIRFLPGLGSLRVNLRHAHIDAQLVRLDNMKKLSPRSPAAPRINQGANVGIARGNYAVEGSIDLLERL